MNIAFIPVRGGSKSIPLKNIKPICGKPLVYWTLKAACGCNCIDKVYVSTDSPVIRETIQNLKNEFEAEVFNKVEVVGRSIESASDTASTEFAMLEFADNHDFDNIVLIQATSPLLETRDLNQGFALYYTDGTDSVLSVVRQKRFNWEGDESGFVHATNYDVFNRPRRQEFDGYLVENGAFYITSRENLLKSRNRISGNIRAFEMDEDSFFEIDEPSDWLIIEALMKKRGITAPAIIPEIKMFITDCDGCLTDSGMYYSEMGDELKKFNTRDGIGFSILQAKGIITGIVTGENVELNRRRAKKLNIDIIEMGCLNKLDTVKRLCSDRGISIENVCYLGDELNDLDVISAVGYACCPADACSEVRRKSHYISKKKGGEGVVRDIAELITQNAFSN